MQPTDEHEIVETIACFSIRKSPGYIDIPIILIKEAKFIITSFSQDVQRMYKIHNLS